jgi:hypothetical protein
MFWLTAWSRHAAMGDAPKANPEPPYRDVTDSRWQNISGFALSEPSEGLVEAFVEVGRRTLTWEDVYALCRAPWDVTRCGVDIALFNLQLGGELPWWPIEGELERDDLILIELAPHVRGEPERFRADWWARRTLEEAVSFRLRGRPPHAVTHPWFRTRRATVPSLLGIVRVAGMPYPVGEQLRVMTDRFVPFPVPLPAAEATERLPPPDAGTFAAGAISAGTWSGERAAALLDVLSHDSWEAAGPLPRARRDRQAFKNVVEAMRAGEVAWQVPRYLGERLGDGATPYAARRSEAGHDAPAAFRFVADGPSSWGAPEVVDRDTSGGDPLRFLADLAPAPGTTAVIAVTEAALLAYDDPAQELLKRLGDCGQAGLVSLALEWFGPKDAVVLEADGRGLGIFIAVALEDIDFALDDVVAVAGAVVREPPSSPAQRQSGPRLADHRQSGPGLERTRGRAPTCDQPTDHLSAVVVATEWQSRKGASQRSTADLSRHLRGPASRLNASSVRRRTSHPPRESC